MTTPESLRLEAVAADLGRSPESVRRAILRGDLPGFRVGRT